MPDAFMPDVQVDIAFNAGFMTPAASRTWTDISAYVELHEGIDINFGRQDERSVADANQMTLTLDNKDGRFTAFRASSPYYPNVKIGRPIRVRVTPPGGSTVTRFVGFIDEWPVEWDGTDSYARAKIRATSRLARLGLSATLRSSIEQEIMALSPAAYFTMGEPSGSTQAQDSRGVIGSTPMTYLSVAGKTSTITFGNATGPATDGLTAVDFVPAFDRKGLTRLGSLTPKTLRAAFRITGLPTTNEVAHLVTVGESVVAGPTNVGKGLWVDDIGRLRGGSSITGPSVNDSLTHDAALTWDGTTMTLYLDGSSVGTSATGFGSGELITGTGLNGVIAHLASYDTALTAAQVASQAQAVLGATERTDQRLLRVLGWAGVPSSEVATETGVQTMTYQVTDGASAVDVLRDVEATEAGVLFDGRDGNVTFHNRSHRYLGATAATLNMASQHVQADYVPKLDRSALVNDATVTNPTTKASARAVDSASQIDYGIAAQSSNCVADTYDPLQQAASWTVASYAEPRIRVPSLSVDVLAHQGLTPSAQTLLGLTVGDVLAVTNAPTQADSTSASYFVEGYTERIGPESYSLTFNLSPTYPTLNVLVLDDANRGKLDTGLLAL